MSLRSYAVAAIVAGLVVAGSGAIASCGGKQTTAPAPGADKPDPARSQAAFVALGAVLTHPRCINCHPSADSPTQGDDLSPHQPPVFRGEAGLGAVGMRCNTCHGESNAPLLERAGTMPGAPGWHLAPITMSWQGLSLGEICEQIKDPARNGEKSLEDLYTHLTEDPLVVWAWDPGQERSPPPLTRDELAHHTRVWLDNGAHCPAP